MGETKLKLYGVPLMNVIREHRKVLRSKHETDDKQVPEYVAQKRAEGYNSAYEKWNESEIDQLKAEYAKGLSIKEIAEIHGRTEGAIRSRLKKEGLID